MAHQTKLFLAVLILFPLAPCGWGREWHDATGKQSCQAELIGQFGEYAKLKTEDGRTVSVPRKALSKADQQYLSEVSAVAQVKVALQQISDVEAPKLTYVAASAQDMSPAPLSPTSQLPGSNLAERFQSGYKVEKFVYHGCKNSFHVFDFGASGFATAFYHFCEPGSGCHPDCKPFLAYLEKTREDAHFRYYTPQNGDPFVDLWALAKAPDSCPYAYSIWYHLKAEPKAVFHQFDYDTRIIPN